MLGSGTCRPQVFVGAQHPAPVVAGDVQLHRHPVLGHQQILLQRRHAPVERELAAAVVALGGVGQHLDDQARVQQQIAAPVVELLLAAQGHQIRILAGVGGGDLQAHALTVEMAGAALGLIPQLAVDVADDGVMLGAAAAHREDLAREIFMALVERPAFALQPVFKAQLGLGLQCHGGLRSLPRLGSVIRRS
jgi:hypothetical protein